MYSVDLNEQHFYQIWQMKRFTFTLGFVGVNYLLKNTHSSKILTYKI